MKKLINKLHLILGLTSGLVVFIVGFTGAIYCWEEELRESIHSDLYEAPSDLGDYSLDSLLVTAKQSHEGKVKFIRIVVQDLNRSVEFGFKDKESVFVHPYTRKVLGSFNRDDDFFGLILQLHRRLMLGDTGEIITGTSCLIFGFMLLSGMFLWWPRSKSIRKQRFKIALKAPRARKIFDLHSVLGFYASWILVFTVITGLVFSFKWFEKGMYAVVGSEKSEEKVKSDILPKKTFSLDSISASISRNGKYVDDYFFSLPEDSTGAIRLSINFEQEGFFKKQDQYFYNQYTGELIATKQFDALSTGEKMRISNLDIHTGRKFGFIGKLIMFFASLIAASLPITGFLYWRARIKATKSAQKTS